jgi:hypothetical protein
MRYFFFDYPGSDKAPAQKFIMVDLPVGESIETALDDLYRATQRRSEDRRDTSIIIRPSVYRQLAKSRIDYVLNSGLIVADADKPDLAFLLLAAKDPKRTFMRFRSHNIYVLYSENYAHRLTENINRLLPASDVISYAAHMDEFLTAIQEGEIDYLVGSSKSKLPPLGDRAYSAPSGRLVRSFLRVGNIQKSVAALDGLFFWLLPHLFDCVGVLTDTWSISSLSQHISRRLVVYDPEVNDPCPVEMLSDYHDADERYGLEASEIIKRFMNDARLRIRRSSQKRTVLVLISATHTGSLRDNINKFLTREGLANNVRFVSVFRLSDKAGGIYLRDYAKHEDFEPFTPKQEKDLERSAIVIDGSVYFPIQAISIIKKSAKETVDSLAAFAADYPTVFARTHYTDRRNPARTRHHAIWLDVSAIVSQPAFATKLKDRVRRLVPAPKVVVCPGHPAARLMVELVKEVLGESGLQYFFHEDLRIDTSVGSDAQLDQALRALDADGSILFMDDAFVTGARIRSYQSNVRQFNVRGTMHYIAAIGRPEQKRLWNVHEQAFLFARGEESATGDRKNTFHAIESLLLPNWGEHDCPWCLEHKVQERLPERFRRTNFLADVSGKSSDLVALPEGQAQPQLMPSSLFGPPSMTQSNLFCLVAALIQSLRTKAKGGIPRLGADIFLVTTTLDMEEYMAYYTDPLLVALFLRATRSNELVYREVLQERSRTERLIQADAASHGELAGELHVAAATDKLPLGSEFGVVVAPARS